MPLLLDHILVSRTLEFETHTSGNSIVFRATNRGNFQVLYPGTLVHETIATVHHSSRERLVPQDPGLPPNIDGIPTGPRFPRPRQPRLPHNGVWSADETIVFGLKIYDPDGQPFTRTEITADDIKKFRDPRGMPRNWLYVLDGSREYIINAGVHESATDPKGTFELKVVETVPMSSAGPLLHAEPVVTGAQRYPFHLDRVGMFIAQVLPPVPGSIRLLDPDGTAIAATTDSKLSCPITLALLGPSDVSKQWALEVETSVIPAGTNPTVEAAVIGEGRINRLTLQKRLQQLLVGHDGQNIQLAGRNRDDKAELLITINNLVAAETLDMHGVLDDVLKHQGLDEIPVGKEFVLYSGSDGMTYSVSDRLDIDADVSVDVNSVRITKIDVTVGPSKYLDPQMPAVRFTLAMTGTIIVSAVVGGAIGGAIAAGHAREGIVELELGLGVDVDGTPRLHVGLPDQVLEIKPLSGGWAELSGLDKPFDQILNDRIKAGAKDLFDDPTLAARILMTVFGAHLHHYQPRFEGDDLLFEHAAMAEPKRIVNLTYKPALGRTVISDGQGGVSFDPPSLPDTWVADNLKSKIKHIVYVMMENRSYDHVLGYRAQAPINDGKDGLTQPIMDAINKAAKPDHDPANPPVRPLRKASFPLNDEDVVQRRTRIPVGVGHSLSDVHQQLSSQIDGPDGRRINGPAGFVANFFEKHLNGIEAHDQGTVPFDVLGYYESRDEVDTNRRPPANVDDLPMFKFLADNYAYCDRYFCSHPGPTMPNRMYSLCGTPQLDRVGTPILDNNHGDNFLLSRAQTIYDLLERHHVSYRVYESAPSVTMLRMFARYAGDDKNIRPFEDDFEKDVVSGNLPSVVVVEPAMHHYPEDDDHPDADMWRGQRFIQRVYNKLRMNDEVWKHTLLVITYDEHGGLYDHVIPPIADVFVPPSTVTRRDETGALPRPGTVSTGDPPPAPPSGGLAIPAFHPPRDTFPLGPRFTLNDPTVQVQYGVRVPTFLVSPWIPADAQSPVILDHCSVLKTILATFCGDTRPFLSERVAASNSFESFVTATTPRMDVAPAPTIDDLPSDGRRRVVGTAGETLTKRDRALYRKQMREGEVDFHDITLRLAHMLGR